MKKTSVGSRPPANVPTISLAQTYLEVKGGGTFNVVINRTGELSYTSSVNAYTIAGTADSTDYEVITGQTVEFAPTETTKTITVATYMDIPPEGYEEFSFKIANPVNAKLGNVDTTLAVQPSDEIVNIFVQSVSVSDITEGNSAVFTVTLNQAVPTGQTRSVFIARTGTVASQYLEAPIYSNGVYVNPKNVGGSPLVVPAGVSQFTVTYQTVTGAAVGSYGTIALQVGAGSATAKVYPVLQLSSLSNIAVFEMPYGMLTAPQRTSISSNGGYVGIVATNADASTDAYAVYSSTTENGTYTKILDNQPYAPVATIAGLVNRAHETLGFNGQLNWPTTITAGTKALLVDTAGQQEFCLANGWSSQTVAGETANILQLTPAIYHSLPIEVSGADSAKIFILDNVAIDTTLKAQNATMYYKIVPKTPQGAELALSSVTPIAVTVTGVANKPYPPRSVGFATAQGSVPTIGEYQSFPTATLLRGDIYIRLANSNRIDETTPSGFSSPSSTREAGSTYSVDVIGRDGQVLRTLTADTNGLALYGFTPRAADGEIDPTEFRTYVTVGGIRSVELTNIVPIEHRESPDITSLSSTLAGSNMTVTFTMEKQVAWPYAVYFQLTGTAATNNRVTSITASNGVTVQEGKYLFIPPNVPSFTVTINTTAIVGEVLTLTAGKVDQAGTQPNTSQTIPASYFDWFIDPNTPKYLTPNHGFDNSSERAVGATTRINSNGNLGFTQTYADNNRFVTFDLAGLLQNVSANAILQFRLKGFNTQGLALGAYQFSLRAWQKSNSALLFEVYTNTFTGSFGTTASNATESILTLHPVPSAFDAATYDIGLRIAITSNGGFSAPHDLSIINFERLA